MAGSRCCRCNQYAHSFPPKQIRIVPNNALISLRLRRRKATFDPELATVESVVALDFSEASLIAIHTHPVDYPIEICPLAFEQFHRQGRSVGLGRRFRAGETPAMSY